MMTSMFPSKNKNDELVTPIREDGVKDMQVKARIWIKPASQHGCTGDVSRTLPAAVGLTSCLP